MKINSILIIFLLTTVFSCNLEREVDLGDEYYLFGDGANTTVSKKVPNKVGVYNDIVLGEIVSYSYNAEYIAIYRDVTEKSKIFFHEHHLWTEENNTPKNQFWIIIKASEEVFGPLSFIEYIELKKTKGINISLNM